MSINIITNTEDFSSSIWSPSGSLVVTTNVAAAPVFAGVSATAADKLEDNDAGAASALLTIPSFSIAADTTNWILSLFVKKDAITTRFPLLLLVFTGGGGINSGISVNTQDGTNADGGFGVAPADRGVVDVDSLWWRFWCKVANDGTNNLIRPQIYPAMSSTIGGGFDGALLGDITAWGINLTNTNTLQTYEPDPFYNFVGAPSPFITQIGAQRLRY